MPTDVATALDIEPPAPYHLDGESDQEQEHQEPDGYEFGEDDVQYQIKAMEAEARAEEVGPVAVFMVGFCHGYCT